MTETLPKLVWTPEMAARFWDFESQHPDRYFAFRYGAELVRQLRTYLIGRGPVLDYGCGPGYLLDQLLAAGIDAAGADFAPDTIDRLNTRIGARPNFRGAFTLEQLGTDKRRFGVVTVIEVIEHLYDEQLEPLLADVPRFLEADGIVVFTTPNEEALEKSFMVCPVSGAVFHRWQHVRNWSRDSLTGYLEAHDFEVIDCYATNFRLGLSKAKKKGPVGTWWAVLKSNVARRRNPKKKPPHLVAIARPRAATGV